MAKRKTLVTPSSEDLSRLEDEFRRETSSRPPLTAPIAHVAAETAAALDLRPASERAAEARDRADASRLRSAEERDLLIREIPLDQIDADALVRDRMSLDPEELQELQTSIQAHGLRLPVEVFEATSAGQGGPSYGLLSGYRRLRAVQNLRAVTGEEKYSTIKASVRDPNALGGSFAAMVEENEIRSGLSHFERGRISVIAAQQGVFPSVEEAVDALFPQASKAKRSKIRSFARIFEELGDMLSFPNALGEREGLRLAGALREGSEGLIRSGLAERASDTALDELDRINEIIARVEPSPVRSQRGGRPTSASTRRNHATPDVKLSVEQDGQGWCIRVEGDQIDKTFMKNLVRRLEGLLVPE